MAKKDTTPKFAYLEKWNTRYGQSERVVIRQGGRFVDNVSLSTLRTKGEPVKTR